ncbi:hypothetical protein GCM10023238_29900 [Streptomyces heliomycini]
MQEETEINTDMRHEMTTKYLCNSLHDTYNRHNSVMSSACQEESRDVSSDTHTYKPTDSYSRDVHTRWMKRDLHDYIGRDQWPRERESGRSLYWNTASARECSLFDLAHAIISRPIS